MSYIASRITPQLRQNIELVLKFTKKHEHEISIAVFVLVCVYLISLLVKIWRRNFPPGPYGVPFVGYMPFLSKDLHIDFNRLAKKYGDVFSLQLGSVDAVVLNGVEAIREAFAKPEFLGRPPDSVFKLLTANSPFFVRDQHVWREHRRFVVQTMKDLGLGKTKIEVDIQEEIDSFLKIIELQSDHLLDPRIPLTPSMSNNICALVFGKRYDYNDPLRKELDLNLDIGNDSVSQTAGPTFFPWMRYIPFVKKLPGLKEGIQAFGTVLNILKTEVQNHKDTLDPKNIRDFTDSYLVEMKQRQIKDPNTTFSYDTLYATVWDLFAAGSETVRTTLHWFMYIIAAHPDVQNKVQQDILEVIGSERKSEYLDQKAMPYTHAVILEMMRWKTIVPLNVLRYTVGDTTVSGYDIPKGTLVMANFWAVHHDPKLWINPEQFQPERFLSADGKTVVKSNNFMPFSVGKRSCPGENMASMEMFLYFTAILQKFHIRLPKGEVPSYPYTFSTVYRRESYKLHFIPRNH